MKKDIKFLALLLASIGCLIISCYIKEPMLAGISMVCIVASLLLLAFHDHHQ